jgi:hypothetical protein
MSMSMRRNLMRAKVHIIKTIKLEGTVWVDVPDDATAHEIGEAANRRMIWSDPDDEFRGEGEFEILETDPPIK